MFPMYDPRNESWREKRNLMSNFASGPVVAPQVTSFPPGAKNQNGVARFDLAAAHEHVPRRQKNQGHAGSLLKVQRIGNGNYVDPRHSNQLAIAAVLGVPKHAELAAHILLAANTLRAVS